MATDLLDKEDLQSYFYNPTRENELRLLVYRLTEKILGIIEETPSESTVLYNLQHLPKGYYKYYSREQFLQYLDENGLGKLPENEMPQPAGAKNKKKHQK